MAVRKHASMNPEALFRDPITVEDIVNSRVISSPLHLPDCCVITDVGGAVVVASPEVARSCRHTPVWVLGVGEAIAHQGTGKRDLMYIAAKQSHEPAFAMAGVTHPGHRHGDDLRLLYQSPWWKPWKTWASARRARAASSCPADDSRLTRICRTSC